MTLDRPLVSSKPQADDPTTPTLANLRAAALAIGAVPYVVHAFLALNGFFWQDDFVITYHAASASPTDLAYLFHAHNGEHLAPGCFVLAWLITAIAPLNFAVAMVPLLAIQAGASVLFWRVLVRCFGMRWAILPGFAVYTFSPLILLPTLWWAYGVQLLPLLLAMSGALYAHVKYLQTQAPRQAVYAGLWLIAGLAFYEKAALIPGLLVAVTMLLAPAGQAFAEARRYALLWLGYAVVLAGYIALYLTLTDPNSVPDDGHRHSEFLELVRRTVVDTLLPGLFGVPGGAGPGVSWLAPAPAVRVLTAVLALGVLAFGLVAGGRRAGLAWLLLAGYVGVDVVVLAATRLGLVGTVAGTDPRYIADAVPVAALFGTFALLGARPRAGRIVAVLTVLIAVAATVSLIRLAPAAQARHGRDYVATATDALAKRPGITVYDGGVPEDIMIDWFAEDARPSRVVGLLPGAPRFDEPTEELYLLGDDGSPKPVRRLDAAVPGVPGPVADCGYAVTEQPTVIRLTSGTLGKRVLRVGYYTAETGDGLIGAGDKVIPVRFESGLHQLFVPVEGLLGSIEVRRSTPLAPVCVTDLQVGVPVG